MTPTSPPRSLFTSPVSHRPFFSFHFFTHTNTHTHTNTQTHTRINLQEVCPRALFTRATYKQCSLLTCTHFLPVLTSYLYSLLTCTHTQTMNADYKTRLSALKNLVLVMFELDTMVQPKESEWFGFYKEGQDKAVYSLFDSDIWTKVWNSGTSE